MRSKAAKSAHLHIGNRSFSFLFSLLLLPVLLLIKKPSFINFSGRHAEGKAAGEGGICEGECVRLSERNTYLFCLTVVFPSAGKP